MNARARVIRSTPEYKAWRKLNRSTPHAKLTDSVRKRVHTVLRGKAVSANTLALLGCSTQEAVAHIESLFKPGMTWANRKLWHIDHKKPLALFDLTDPVQLAAACHYTNLQPLWAVENLKKGISLA